MTGNTMFGFFVRASLMLGVMVTGVAYRTVAADQAIRAEYDFFWKGFLVSSAETAMQLDGADYVFSLNFRTRGIARLFSGGHTDIHAQGFVADGGAVIPREYLSSGRWDGEDYSQTMRFDTTGKLLEQKIDWPKEWLEDYNREPVPDDMQVGPDPASLVVAFMRMPLPVGDSDVVASVRAFDGDTVVDWQLICAGQPVVLEPTKHSDHDGAARDCTIRPTLVAGKLIETEKQRLKREKREAKEARRREKNKGKDEDAAADEDGQLHLWLQQVAGSPYYLPVRATVLTGMGTVRMYLKDLAIGEPAVQQSR